jgi:hypothetical protein
MPNDETKSARDVWTGNTSRITALESALSEAGQGIRSISAMARTAAEQTRSSIQAALRHLADGRSAEAVDILRGAVADLDVGIGAMSTVH